jgi:Cu/Ag efflux protein CusF
MSIAGYTKKTLLIGVAAVGLVAAAASANAQSSTSAQGSSATQAPSSPSSATQAPSAPTQAPPAATQAPSSQTGTTASANKELATKELSGVVKKIDKDKRSLKISSPAGVEQDVKLAASATITRDGTKAGFDQLKEGDDIRASFDPTSDQATKLDVQSKQMMEKGTAKSGMKSETKTEPETKPETKPEGKAKY